MLVDIQGFSRHSRSQILLSIYEEQHHLCGSLHLFTVHACYAHQNSYHCHKPHSSAKPLIAGLHMGRVEYCNVAAWQVTYHMTLTHHLNRWIELVKTISNLTSQQKWQSLNDEKSKIPSVTLI